MYKRGGGGKRERALVFVFKMSNRRQRLREHLERKTDERREETMEARQSRVNTISTYTTIKRVIVKGDRPMTKKKQDWLQIQFIKDCEKRRLKLNR